MSHTSSHELGLAQLGAIGQRGHVSSQSKLSEGLLAPLDGAFQEEVRDNASVHEEHLLPKPWLASPQIREGLRSEKSPLRTKTRLMSTRPSLSIARLSSMSATGDGYGLCGLAMFDPSSRFLLAWHFLSAVVLLSDLIMIPYALAWDLKLDEGVLYVAGWSHACFWIVDLVIAFRTGFYNRAELVLDPRRVAANYLTSWFLLDGFLVACDLTSMLAATDFTGQGVNLLRTAKLSRILRIAGVLRMYRLVQLIERQMIDGRYKLTAKVVSIVLQMVCFNHVTSCAWFAIGVYAPTDTGEHWVDDLAMSSHQDIYEYVSALHWSVAQFTMGATDIVCTNSIERAFNICFLFLGLVWSSTIISTLSATAIDYQIARADTLRKVRQVAQFFKDHRVERRVAQQVHEQVWERLWTKETLLYGDVEAFKILSTSVQRSLHYELFKKYFKPHGLFRLWSRLERNTTQTICHYACKYTVIMRMDDLFMPGVLAKGAYYLATGNLHYTQSPTSAPVEEELVEEVTTGTWISETALWTYWTHVGTAEALEPSQLLVMNGDALAKALQNETLVRQVTVAYCQTFYKNLLAAKPPRRPWPNDLRVPFTDYETLVMGMDQEEQEVIGLDAIETLLGFNGRLPSLRANVDALIDEVQSGAATIILSAEANDLERLVQEVSLRVQDDEARLLVQVASQESAGGHIQPGCHLPAGKQFKGEDPETAIQRLIETELVFLKDRLQLEDMEQQEEVKRHAKYAIHTKILRTVCNARLTSEIERSMFYRMTCGTPGHESPVKQWGARAAVGRGEMGMRRMYSTTRTSLASFRMSHAPTIGPQSTSELLSSIALCLSGEEGRLSFYCWVTPSQFTALRKTSDRALRQWIEHQHAKWIEQGHADHVLQSDRTSATSTILEFSPAASRAISPWPE